MLINFTMSDYSILKKHIAENKVEWKNTVSYITYKRTYARKLNDNTDETEEFTDTLFRVIKGCNEQLGMALTPEEQCKYYDMFAKFKASVAGRFLWQLGTKTVKKYGLLSLQNCAFTNVSNIEAFCWVFDCLMLGCVPPDSPVLTERGIVKICDIKVGDRVWSWNGSELEYRPVTQLHDVKVLTSENIKICGIHGSLITSKKHPILVRRGGAWIYVKAGNIQLGDVLQRFNHDAPPMFNEDAWVLGKRLSQDEYASFPNSMKGYDKNVFMSFLCGAISASGSVYFTIKSLHLMDELCDYAPLFNVNIAYDLVETGARVSIPGNQLYKYRSFIRNAGVEIKEEKYMHPTVVPLDMLNVESAKFNDDYFINDIKRKGFTNFYGKYDIDDSHLQGFDVVVNIETNLEITEDFKDITVQNNNSYVTGYGSYYTSHNSGTGYNIQKKYTDQLPVPHVVVPKREDTKDADFIVPDSREGWIQLLRTVLRAHFDDEPLDSFTYSCLCLRSKGAPIKGFGGTASGPEYLCKGIEDISKIINKRAEQKEKMRPIDCLDVMNIIARTVVSGNVRRCLPKGTLVHTTNGLVPIEKINTNHMVKLPFGEFRVEGAGFSGRKSVFIIETTLGPFRCTAEHKMAVWNKNNPEKYVWKRASDLGGKDMLVHVRQEIEGSPTYVNDIGSRTMLDAKLAYFFGYAHGKAQECVIGEHVRFKYDKFMDFIEPERLVLSIGMEDDHFTIKSEQFAAHMRTVLHKGIIPDYILEAPIAIRKEYLLGYEAACSLKNIAPKNMLLSVQAVYASIGKTCKVNEFEQSLEVEEAPYFYERKKRTYNPLRILRIYKTHAKVDTYDITVAEAEQFIISGGYLTHNSAQIAIGDYTDIEFLNAKRWDKGIPNWRCYSNNSVVCDDTSKLPAEFWDGYKGNGECYGLINLDLSRKIGRTGETQYPDPNVEGYNPSLRAGTKVLTSDGIFPVEELQDTKFMVRNIEGTWSEAKCWKSGDDVLLYELLLQNGKKYYCSAEHKWPVLRENHITRVATTEILSGQTLLFSRHSMLFDNNRGTFEDGYCIGSLYSSPTKFAKTDYSSTTYTWMSISGTVRADIIEEWIRTHDADAKIGRSTRSILSTKFDCITVTSDILAKHVITLGGIISYQSEYDAPSLVWTGSNAFRRGFIQGVCSITGDDFPDANVQARDVCTVYNASKKFISGLMDLFGFYGMMPCIGENPTTLSFLKDHCRNVVLGKQVDRTGIIKVVSCRPTNMRESVWDVSVFDDHHAFALSHCITGNCGEQSLENRETCVTGSTRIQTRAGSVMIGNVIGREIEVWNGEEWSTVTPFCAKENDDFLKVTFSDGSHVNVTHGHEFKVDESKIRACDLKIGMEMPVFSMQIDASYDSIAYTAGLFMCAGFVDNRKAYITVPEDRVSVFDRCKYVNVVGNTAELDNYRFWKSAIYPFTGLPDRFMRFGKTNVLEFIAGWLDAKHTSLSHGLSSDMCTITLTSTPKIMRDLQILARRGGINFAQLQESKMTHLYIDTAECPELPSMFAKMPRRKVQHIPQKVVSISRTFKSASYCFTEPKKHMGVFGNVLTHQCCLMELFLPNIESQKELSECAKMVYRIAKHSLALPCHQKTTEHIVHKNMRMGIGITGVLQSHSKMDWLDRTYKELRAFDEKYSAQHGYPTSVKLTTVKPSGCVTLDTRVVTRSGIKTFAQIFDENNVDLSQGKWYTPVPFEVRDCNNEWQTVTKLFNNGIKQIMELVIDGKTVNCTPDHKFLVNDEWVMAKNLNKGDVIKSYIL